VTVRRDPLAPNGTGRWQRQIKNGDRLSLATAHADGDDVVVATKVERDDFNHDTDHGGFKWQLKVFLSGYQSIP
jgi:hypothetical protein